MKALLIVSHGSRRKASNTEVIELTRKVQEISKADFEIIDAAFLELAEPSIPDGINCCIERGATTIVVFPYFLAAGTHVANDIPDIIKTARKANPGVEIILKPHLGGVDMMPKLIADASSLD